MLHLRIDFYNDHQFYWKNNCQFPQFQMQKLKTVQLQRFKQQEQKKWKHAQNEKMDVK